MKTIAAILSVVLVLAMTRSLALNYYAAHCAWRGVNYAQDITCRSLGEKIHYQFTDISPD